ncbi:hypothetical protein AG1IA_09002 [Rhizoctonia solani AG-1 IA]|uniref:Uncharacterized protein n=1 Tax=Thanatephorus cucumeris (strain AG1-IA) TaxID=983506 RepID=L8WKR9_THACA|nr:hypothetical protein AG1IA_09002 [Rhizoctonia solani AG-1 IA]
MSESWMRRFETPKSANVTLHITPAIKSNYLRRALNDSADCIGPNGMLPPRSQPQRPANFLLPLYLSLPVDFNICV